MRFSLHSMCNNLLWKDMASKNDSAHLNIKKDKINMGLFSQPYDFKPTCKKNSNLAGGN